MDGERTQAEEEAVVEFEEVKEEDEWNFLTGTSLPGLILQTVCG